jgi:hypothetical protein
MVVAAADEPRAPAASPAPSPAPALPILADLPQKTRALLQEGGADLAELGAPAVLDAVLRAAPPYEFVAGPLVVHTDVRWFSTLPGESEQAALLELRRWPGDSVLALYDLREAAARTPPAWPEAAWTPIEETRADVSAWEGAVETPAGTRPAMWIVRRIGDERPWLGALLLPGDAGLGQEGTEAITEEMLAILARVEVREAAWKARGGIPPSAPPLFPVTVEAPGPVGENESPWQVARGTGFTIGVPPGIRVRVMDGDVPPPQELPGGLLWMRGRFADGAGGAVVIGDAERFGYVARVASLAEEWTTGQRAPLGAPGASRLASEPYALAAERTGAAHATAERWSEPGYPGQWLVFRLQLEGRGYEIALPVNEGRRSASLFWIPATWRDESKPPAPPPVDPAERFGIRFERLTRTDRLKAPWVEGNLAAPGLAVEVGLGLFPAASLRSHDGYPVRFLDERGMTVGSVVRVPAEHIAAARAEHDGLVELDKPGRHRAARVLHDADETYLFVAPGEDHAFLFEFSPPAGAPAKDAQRWRELWSVMLRSVRLKD